MQSPSGHSALRVFVGELVIVLPDLEDYVSEEDSLGSQGDVRYMGVLADADDRVIVLNPYFKLPRKSDPDKERQIALLLRPDAVQEEEGIRARIRRGGASMAGGDLNPTAAMIRRPKIVPVEQCDAIDLYRDIDPEDEIRDLVSALPEPSVASDKAIWSVPSVPRMVVLPSTSLSAAASELEQQAEAEKLIVVHVPGSTDLGDAGAARSLLAMLAERAGPSADGSELAVRIGNVTEKLAADDAPHLHLRLEFPRIIDGMLALEPGCRGLVAALPRLSLEQEKFLEEHCCSHPNLIYIISRP